jgi:NAD(P)-dependent dehydrogenase (short-subunit alcohol dehydrogenase family)
MDEFADRVVLITGAGKGIGRQLARVLSAEGAAIAAVDLTPEPLSSLEHEIAGKPMAWAVADVVDTVTLTKAIRELERKLGPVDLLIANAGIGRETSAMDFLAEEVAALVRVNLIGVSNSIAAVLPGMRIRRRGHLVALSSLASYRGLPRIIGYCAAKAGVNTLMEGLRLELRGQNINCTTVCPGWIRSDMTAKIRNAPQMMEIEDAVREIVWAIRRKKVFHAFPRSRVWPLRLLRLFPSQMGDWLAARAFQREYRRTEVVQDRDPHRAPTPSLNSKGAESP